MCSTIGVAIAVVCKCVYVVFERSMNINCVDVFDAGSIKLSFAT